MNSWDVMPRVIRSVMREVRAREERVFAGSVLDGWVHTLCFPVGPRVLWRLEDEQ